MLCLHHLYPADSGQQALLLCAGLHRSFQCVSGLLMASMTEVTEKDDLLAPALRDVDLIVRAHVLHISVSYWKCVSNVGESCLNSADREQKFPQGKADFDAVLCISQRSTPGAT